jgi:hypothetical protein
LRITQNQIPIDQPIQRFIKFTASIHQTAAMHESIEVDEIFLDQFRVIKRLEQDALVLAMSLRNQRAISGIGRRISGKGGDRRRQKPRIP